MINLRLDMAWTIGTKFGVIMAILVLGAVTDICNSTPIDRQTRNDGIENYLTQLKGQTALSGRLRWIENLQWWAVWWSYIKQNESLDLASEFTWTEESYWAVLKAFRNTTEGTINNQKLSNQLWMQCPEGGLYLFIWIRNIVLLDK